MLKMLGAAVAAVALACAGSAGAAVIDFEGYTLGASTAGQALAGTPYAIAGANGTITEDPAGSGGKVLALTLDADNDGYLRIFSGVTGDKTEWGLDYAYLFDLVSFDVWVPADTHMIGSAPDVPRTALAGGQWTTFTWTGRSMEAGNRWAWRISDGPSYIDNIVFANEHIAAVPEPATWAMLILGFGLTGAALRRRQRVAIHIAVDSNGRGHANA